MMLQNIYGRGLLNRTEMKEENGSLGPVHGASTTNLILLIEFYLVMGAKNILPPPPDAIEANAGGSN